MTYGCEVTGLADAELLTVQRFGALALPPGGAGRSLSAVLALHGDDSFYPALAPLLQWSKEVWNATTQWGLAGVGMSLPELRRSWQSALGGTNTPAWRSCHGPLEAAWLSIGRVGWKWPEPFVLLDVPGNRIVLTEHSPALVKKMLRAAWHTRLEQRTAASLGKLHGLSELSRACLDPLRSWLRYRFKSDPHGAAIVRGVVCGSRWTADRAVAAGYQHSGRCPLCEEPDGSFHRTWVCKNAQAARERAAPGWLQKIARARGAKDPLYCFGIIEHPETTATAPLCEGGFVIERFDGRTT